MSRATRRGGGPRRGSLSGVFPGGARTGSEIAPGTPGSPVQRTLERLIASTRDLDGIRREDLEPGDRLVVETKNSSYSILVLGDGRYRVSGGWFDRHGASPATVTINGCTFGARAILTDVVAGRDLFLEFGNNVVTTRIRGYRVIRPRDDGRVH